MLITKKEIYRATAKTKVQTQNPKDDCVLISLAYKVNTSSALKITQTR